MATYLQLVQKLASETGTISGTQPSTVVGQTGRLGKMARWVSDAWTMIQGIHGEWRWMRSDFSGSTVASTRAYASTDLGIASRFGEWICEGPDESRFSLYLTATGVADEGQLFYRDYDWFWTNCMRGAQSNDRPSLFTITPDNKIALHPIPDAVYTIRGPYRKDAQILAADSDTPEMPSRFHDLIIDVALEFFVDVHDEVPQTIQMHRLRRIPRFVALERDQLPPILMAGALA